MNLMLTEYTGLLNHIMLIKCRIQLIFQLLMQLISSLKGTSIVIPTLEKTSDGTYRYHGVNEMPTDDWDALICMYTEREIDFFQSENNILDLISDITELQKWLVSENYISKDGVIKGKMVDNLNLV
ncbi:Uncharacterised protein [Proteus mirabilis]|uniref:hypothetical protein n=1 Tax=Proteus mirabilis TaxID=584 RepID=UPI000DFF7BF0|nr:hypothetical protein [Proteus mirabilis]SUC18000.1 Uncharacterised protein [Proteus mirabilis]